jgi:hypothetical protein
MTHTPISPALRLSALPRAFHSASTLTFPRGEHAALDGVDLRHEVAVARCRHIMLLEQVFELGRPALLGLIGEVLAHDLPEVSRQVLGEVHTDAAPVD